MTKTHTVRGDVGMDGSAATSFAERTRSQISRAFSGRSANEVTAQSELFEQLLNLKFTVQPPPENPTPAIDSSVPQSTSTVDNKDDAPKVDDEKDDEPAVTIATLTQAVPLVAEKPVEVAANQSTVAVEAEEALAKSTDTDASNVDQQLTALSVDSQASNDSSAQVDAEAIVTDAPVVDDNVNATTSKLENTNPELNAEVRKPDEDTSDKKNIHAALKPEENTNQTQGLEELKPQESDEKNSEKAKAEIVLDVKPAHAQNEDCEDRRGDRREKWFERKDEVVAETAFERPDDTSGVNAAQEELDPLLPQVKEATPQPTTALPSNVPQPVETTATQAAFPSTLAINAQNVPISNPSSSTTTSSSSPTSTSPIAAAPTRTVGHQTAKADSKDVAPEPGLSQQERVRVIQRIARSFNRISAEGGTINLRLHPEHLGSVSVQVRLEGRSLSARLSTETTAARDAIMQDLPALRQRLADQGFDVTKFQVEVAGNGADASFAQSNGQSQFGQSENRSSGAQTDYRRVAAMRESRAAITRQMATATNSNWQPGSGIDLQA